MQLVNFYQKLCLSILFASLSAVLISACASTPAEQEGSEETASDAAAATHADSSAPPAPDSAAAPAPEAPPGGGSGVGAPSESPSMQQPMNSSRRVLYVKVGGAKIFDKAGGGSVVGKLKKGDHMLVNVEGDWARTDDEKFISMKNLSSKGVGRAKPAAAWSGPRGVSVTRHKEKKAAVAKKQDPAATSHAPPKSVYATPEAAPEAAPEAMPEEGSPEAAPEN